MAFINPQLNRDYSLVADYGLYELPSLKERRKFHIKQVDKSYRFGDYLLFEARGVLFCFDMVQDQTRWSVEVGILKQFLCVHNGILWLEGALTSSYSTIRAFDVSTGAKADYLKHVELPAEPIAHVTPDGSSLFCWLAGA